MSGANGRIGVMSRLVPDASNLGEVADYGLGVCQLVSWQPELWTEATAAAVRQRMSAVRISAFWAGWPGPKVWDFAEGPDTLGIVPERYRAERVAALKEGGRFAERCGLPAVITHLGFIPENPTDPRFAAVVEAVRDIARDLQDRGLEFWFETGQETPVTMLRLIQAVGTTNLGINLDPANLILYGKANPIDALEVFGRHVRNVHVKDGLYPTDPMKLGREVRVGEGRVRFPEFLEALAALGYRGELIIEREISGEQQRRDIHDTVAYLERLLGR